MKRFLMTAACLCLTATVHAGDWVATDFNENLLELINYDGMEVNGNIRGLWVLDVVNKDKSRDICLLSWREYNCKTKKFRTFQGTIYVNGKPFDTRKYKDQSWLRVIPGTIGEASFEHACKRVESTVYTDDVATDVEAKARQAMKVLKLW